MHLEFSNYYYSLSLKTYFVPVRRRQIHSLIVPNSVSVEKDGIVNCLHLRILSKVVPECSGDVYSCTSKLGLSCDFYFLRLRRDIRVYFS